MLIIKAIYIHNWWLFNILLKAMKRNWGHISASMKSIIFVLDIFAVTLQIRYVHHSLPLIANYSKFVNGWFLMAAINSEKSSSWTGSIQLYIFSLKIQLNSIIFKSTKKSSLRILIRFSTPSCETTNWWITIIHSIPSQRIFIGRFVGLAFIKRINVSTFSWSFKNNFFWYPENVFSMIFSPW